MKNKLTDLNDHLFMQLERLGNEDLETEKATEVAGLNERLGMLHSYQARQGCMVCSKCGTAKHKGKFDGFKFWFAGVGYEAEPTCRTAT